MGFLRFILIVIIVYYVAKFIMRLLAPLMAKKMMEKAAENFEKQFKNPYYKEKPQVKEGQTVIDKKSQEKKPSSGNDSTTGEYVDYEEID